MEFPPFFGGGIGTYCKYWTEILSNKGVEVTVFLADPNISSVKEELKNNIRLVRFSPYECSGAPPLGYNTLTSYAYAKIIEKYLVKEGVPAVLEAQEYNGIAYYILQYKHLNYPLFRELYVQIVCHAPSFLYLPVNKVPIYQLPYFWIGEMEKFCILAADVLIAPSQYIIEQIMKSVCLDGKEIRILPNPYCTADYKIAISTQQNTAVFYGKLSPSKGIFELLDFFTDLWEKGITLQLVLAGDENYYYHPEMATCGEIIRKKYRKEILARKLVLKGSMPFVELTAIIQAAKFIVLPSVIDNFPYTVVESMSLGKVVLTSLQGGQAELINHGVNGFLFDHQKPATFIDQVEKILALKAGDFKKIGEAAIKTVAEKCDVEAYFLKRFELCEHPVKINNELYPYTRKYKSFPEPLYVASPDENDLLSVVIPFYNLGKYILEAVQSVYDADYENIEVIIVNDGSTGKFDIDQLMLVKKKYPLLKIISTKNNGLSIARNTGALQASGQFITFLDADDKVHSAYYSKSIELLKSKSNVHFTGCWTQYFGKSNDLWPALTPEAPFLLVHNMVNSSALVYKTKSFLSAGLNDPDLLFGMEDYDSVIAMVKQGLGGVVLPETLFYYRVRANSMARKFNRNKILYLHQLIAQKHSKFYANFAVEISNLLIANGPGYKYDNPTLDYHQFSGVSLKHRLIQKAVTKIKKFPLLKKAAVKIYRYIKK
jgi:glycosyltransferase involved in cell wall biosynthesis